MLKIVFDRIWSSKFESVLVFWIQLAKRNATIALTKTVAEILH